MGFIILDGYSINFECEVNMNNIYVRMSGRLGNQLFRYATARYIQETQGGRLIFDFSPVYKEGKVKPGEIGFENSLKYFKIKEYDEKSATVLDTDKGNIKQKIYFIISMCILRCGGVHSKIFEWLNNHNSRNGLYITLYGPRYCEIRNSLTKDKFVYGRFEDIKYFDKIRDKLLNELQPVEDELVENKDLYDILKSDKQTVCISIRRGDYVSNIEFEKKLNICTKEYFERAVNCIKQKIDNPIFIVFSDDIEWCKANIDFIKKENCYFESGNDPIWEKLRLMYMCKHFIISNSTFSWWSQYLSRNEEKIVIAPSSWFKNDNNGSKYPLLLDSFIKI